MPADAPFISGDHSAKVGAALAAFVQIVSKPDLVPTVQQLDQICRCGALLALGNREVCINGVDSVVRFRKRQAARIYQPHG